VRNMQNEIQTLIQDIKNDFIKFATRNGTKPLEGYFAGVVDKFEEGVEVREGSKYTKIIRDGGVWGFIVNTDKDKKFKYGDILMAAGYNAPARNKARGNIFENYSVAWTGPHYLK